MKVTHGRAKSAAILFGALLTGAFVPAAFGQNPKLDIQNLEPLAKKASEVVDVNLDGALLRLAGKFMTDEDDREGLEIIKNSEGHLRKEFRVRQAQRILAG